MIQTWSIQVSTVPRCIHLPHHPLPHRRHHGCHSIVISVRAWAAKLAAARSWGTICHLEVSPFNPVLHPVATMGIWPWYCKLFWPNKCSSCPVWGKAEWCALAAGSILAVRWECGMGAVDGGMLKVMGIICRTLSTNHLIHIPNHGDFQLSTVCVYFGPPFIQHLAFTDPFCIIQGFRQEQGCANGPWTNLLWVSALHYST